MGIDMNGTTLRAATAVACIAALAAPGSAMAAKKKHRVVHKAQQVFVPHKYDAGGDGIELTPVADGVRVNLFDPVKVAEALGNQALTQLGLPALPAPTL
jgi:hypothetical protein